MTDPAVAHPSLETVAWIRSCCCLVLARPSSHAGSLTMLRSQTCRVITPAQPQSAENTCDAWFEIHETSHMRCFISVLIVITLLNVIYTALPQDSECMHVNRIHLNEDTYLDTRLNKMTPPCKTHFNKILQRSWDCKIIFPVSFAISNSRIKFNWWDV